VKLKKVAQKTHKNSRRWFGSFGIDPIVSCLHAIVRENTHSRFFNWVIQRSSVVERSAVNLFQAFFAISIAHKGKALAGAFS
jgi:hypothetical protein